MHKQLLLSLSLPSELIDVKSTMGDNSAQDVMSPLDEDSPLLLLRLSGYEFIVIMLSIELDV